MRNRSAVGSISPQVYEISKTDGNQSLSAVNGHEFKRLKVMVMQFLLFRGENREDMTHYVFSFELEVRMI